MRYILYNPLSNNKKGLASLKIVENKLKDNYTSINIIGLNIKEFMSTLTKDDSVILVGGDGTLNHFINDVDLDNIHNNISIYSAGTGNDFLNDLDSKLDFPIINKYLTNLPIVTINNKSRYFINGIGYGIDGYCCSQGDKEKLKTNKKINYTKIALKGLMYDFKPKKATVSVDGIKHEYDNVWLAPCMKGRFYGGKMMIAPNQDRNSNLLTSVVCKSNSKLRLIMLFPSIFKGNHIKYDKYVTINKGKEIEVSFSTPCPLQIDGETVENVTNYKVKL